MSFNNKWFIKEFSFLFYGIGKEGGNLNCLSDFGGTSADFDGLILDPEGLIRNGDYRISNGLFQVMQDLLWRMHHI
jgi:hypothetical protein